MKKLSYSKIVLAASIVFAIWAAPYTWMWLFVKVPGCIRADIWPEWFVWAFIVAEMGIFIPYVWIPCSLYRVIRGRGDIPFNRLVSLFGSFIFSCGLTHAVVILTIFHPFYRFELLLLAACAMVSNATAYILHGSVRFLIGLPPIGTILAAKDHAERDAQAAKVAQDLLAAANAELEQNDKELRKANAELKHQAEELALARAAADRQVDSTRAANEKLETLYRDLQAAHERVRLQENAIRDLSTPILELGSGVLLAPLIGALDSHRAAQFMDVIAAETVAKQGGTVIIDVSGVPVADTQVVDTLVKASKVLRLLGAQCFMTGIRPAVAQTIIGLGVEVSMQTFSTLAKGLEAARAK